MVRPSGNCRGPNRYRSKQWPARKDTRRCSRSRGVSPGIAQHLGLLLGKAEDAVLRQVSPGKSGVGKMRRVERRVLPEQRPAEEQAEDTGQRMERNDFHSFSRNRRVEGAFGITVRAAARFSVLNRMIQARWSAFHLIRNHTCGETGDENRCGARARRTEARRVWNVAMLFIGVHSRFLLVEAAGRATQKLPLTIFPLCETY